MSDLTDALDKYDLQEMMDNSVMRVIVDAARWVADPDYQAAKRAFNDTWSKPEVGGTQGIDSLGITLRVAINAAIGITEDDTIRDTTNHQSTTGNYGVGITEDTE